LHTANPLGLARRSPREGPGLARSIGKHEPRENPMKPIADIARRLDIAPDHLEPYGHYKAKISLAALENRTPRGKLVLVSAITPTPAGEGKTTCSIGLAQGLAKIGKKSAVALREPSLGPYLGMKGGGTGGGKSQVVPADDINLHFTGDIHAVSSAHNLL